MDNLPTVVTLPFADGVRDVPEHIANLLKQHGIATYQLTYDAAIERLNLANAEKAVDDAFNKIVTGHLRQFG